MDEQWSYGTHHSAADKYTGYSDKVRFTDIVYLPVTSHCVGKAYQQARVKWVTITCLLSVIFMVGSNQYKQWSDFAQSFDLFGLVSLINLSENLVLTCL